MVFEYKEHLSRVYLPISSNFIILYFFTSKNGSCLKWLRVDFCQKNVENLSSSHTLPFLHLQCFVAQSFIVQIFSDN